jgi:hypothetical protein
MATQDDILTTQKNGVVGVNQLTQTWSDYLRAEHGTSVSKCVDAATVITQGSGYVISISVVEKGTKAGFLYDAATVEAPKDEDRLMAVKMDEGVFLAGFKFKSGLLVVPGEGQAVTITYSMD